MFEGLFVTQVFYYSFLVFVGTNLVPFLERNSCSDTNVPYFNWIGEANTVIYYICNITKYLHTKCFDVAKTFLRVYFLVNQD